MFPIEDSKIFAKTNFSVDWNIMYISKFVRSFVYLAVLCEFQNDVKVSAGYQFVYVLGVDKYRLTTKRRTGK